MRIYLIVFALFFSSCATLVNNRTTKISIDSEIDSLKFAVNDDTTRWYSVPTVLVQERSAKSIQLKIKKDTVQSTTLISSQPSTALVWGNLFSWGIIGWTVDYFSPKGYAYPRFMHITYDDKSGYQIKKYDKREPGIKNQLFFKVAIPEVNQFYLNTGKQYDYRIGCLGISGGVEYYYKRKTCINFDFGAMTDFLLPFPAPVDNFDSYDRSFATYANVQHGNDFRLFHIDYGFQVNRTKFYRWEEDTTTINHFYSYGYTYRENNLGLAFSGYFKCSRMFNLGVNYYPSVYHWTSVSSRMKYTYLLFFELLFRFETNRPVRKN